LSNNSFIIISFVLFSPSPTIKTVTMASNKDFHHPFSEDPESSTFATENQFEDENALPFEIDDEILPNTAKYHMYFCGCCCDFRRAVLVVNGISIVLRILLMVGVAILPSYVAKNLDDIESTINDDETRKQVDTFAKSGNLVVLAAIVEVVEVVAIGFAAIGIYGALKFKQWGIITALTFYAFSMLLVMMSIRADNIIPSFVNLSFAAVFVYPHVCMLILMRAGIMTNSNLHNIAKCCGDRRV
jgi:hypothetical protein